MQAQEQDADKVKRVENPVHSYHKKHAHLDNVFCTHTHKPLGWKLARAANPS